MVEAVYRHALRLIGVPGHALLLPATTGEHLVLVVVLGVVMVTRTLVIETVHRNRGGIARIPRHTLLLPATTGEHLVLVRIRGVVMIESAWMIQAVHRLDGRGERHLARRRKQCARRGKRRQTCDNAVLLHVGCFPYSLTEQLRNAVYSLEYQAMPS